MLIIIIRNFSNNLVQKIIIKIFNNNHNQIINYLHFQHLIQQFIIMSINININININIHIHIRIKINNHNYKSIHHIRVE